MTQKQKTVIVAMVIVNILIISILVMMATRSPSASTSPFPTPTARPKAPTKTLQGEALTPNARLSGMCQWQATQHLAQAGLGGTVALSPDGVLLFEIPHALAPGQTASEAAQLIWTALDVVLALNRAGECGSLSQVEITILAQDDQGSTRISARVSAADLAAYGTGELSEDAFIERVTYTIGDR
jgi:ribosomal protein S28E/S33